MLTRLALLPSERVDARDLKPYTVTGSLMDPSNLRGCW
jgi:hypothetical protein